MPLSLSRASDADLLSMRFCDLPISLTGTAVAALAASVFAELSERGLSCRPAIWLSEEWFNPDGVVGFAVPFYLAHPRLMRLEKQQMLEVEGRARGECLRILRHETGHAVDEAYQLFRTEEYCRTFGAPTRPYPAAYAIDARSRDYVMHLNAWYAQAHPVEDFAETFAVWLTGRSRWQRRYRGWPALAKLEVVDRWMAGWRDRGQKNTNCIATDTLTSNRRTLAQHYAEKRSFYAIGTSAVFDPHLKVIFPAADGKPKLHRADRFIRLVRSTVRKQVARPLAVPAYTVDQILRQIIARCTALDLKVSRDSHETVGRIIELATKATIEAIERGRMMPL